MATCFPFALWAKSCTQESLVWVGLGCKFKGWCNNWVVSSWVLRRHSVGRSGCNGMVMVIVLSGFGWVANNWLGVLGGVYGGKGNRSSGCKGVWLLIG
ncbi:hypothetical protein OIU76_014516 [Salix suchowensis]|nr:hypothetical protein OIU76_014516 [Salix suchowensis]